jgi:DNA (cytosine-5)-methyltransferase 1
MTHGELFAGYGGFGLGFERAGIRTVWRVEIDRDCQRVLRHHHPDDLLLSDVRECGAHNLPPVDVISGGFPCQDLSVAGKRAGLKGGRSGLFYEMTRVVHGLQPRFLVWENVPGLLSSDRGRDFARVLVELERIRFHGCWTVLDAQWFGVPQRRRRVFGVFARRDIGAECCAEILSLFPRSRRHPPPGREKGARVAPAVTPGARRASGQRSGGQLTVAKVLTTGYGEQSGRDYENGRNLVTHALTRRWDGSEDGTGRGTPLVAQPIPFDMRQASRGETMTNNRGEDACSGGAPGTGIGEAGDPAPSLAETHTPAVAYQCHGSNVGPMGTLRAGNGNEGGGVPFVINAAESCAKKDHARESETARSLDTTGGFAANQGGTVVAQAVQEDNQNGVCVRDTAGSLRADAPGHQPCGSLVATTVTWRGRGLEEGGPIANAIRSSGEGHTGDQSGYVRAGMVVRRLLPVECARLMSVPDDYLDLDPPLSDSAKYRLLGNGVVVNVAEWIGRRIVEVLACPQS